MATVGVALVLMGAALTLTSVALTYIKPWRRLAASNR